MKLVIFGATGSIGRHLVAQALAQGHKVTAFARDPAKVDTRHENLAVVQGDVLDAASVEKAVRGQEAVLCSLGAGSRGLVRSQGTGHIVQAMQRAGLRRFICQSTLGVGTSWDNLNFFWKYPMFGLLLRKAFADHVEQEQRVVNSDLDWTIVRPGAFTDGDRTGIYRHGFSPDERGITLKISRADVADFMLKQLADDAYLHKTPGLCY